HQIRGHVGREEIGVVLLHRILAGKLDLIVDDVKDRRLLEPFGPGLGERVVEVRPDLPSRSRRGERMATGADVLEQLPPVLLVGRSPADGTPCPARREDQYYSHPPGGC